MDTVLLILLTNDLVDFFVCLFFQAFIPVTPQILSLTPDFSTEMLYLKWKDGGSAFPFDLDATWQIEVLRKETLERVAQVSPVFMIIHMLFFFIFEEVPLKVGTVL